MDERDCALCTEFVSKDDCEIYRKEFKDCMKTHEERLNRNDVDHATLSTEMRGVKWILGAILTVMIAAWVTMLLRG